MDERHKLFPLCEGAAGRCTSPFTSGNSFLHCAESCWKKHSGDWHSCVSPPNPAQAHSLSATLHLLLILACVLRGVAVCFAGHGDGMMCFAHVAANATAVEYDQPYCDRLRVRSHGSFHVHCADYRKGLPPADVYTWWQQEPSLTDSSLLAFLRREAAAGRVPVGAQAIPIFDLSWEADVRSWQALKAQSFWHRKLSFDERAMCLAAEDPWEGRHFPRDGPISNGYTCKRARGSFIVGGFRLHSKLRNAPDVELEAMRGTSQSDHDPSTNKADVVPGPS